MRNSVFFVRSDSDSVTRVSTLFKRSWIPKKAQTPTAVAESMAKRLRIGMLIAVLSLTSSLSGIYAPHESQLSSQTHGSWLQAGHSLVAIAVTTLLLILLVHSLILLQEKKQILMLFLYGFVLSDYLLVLFIHLFYFFLQITYISN